MIIFASRNESLPPMKRILLLIFLALWCSCAAAQSILYIGNSYTYYNDSPSILDSLALSTGRRPQIEKFTKGGYTMARHLSEEQCREKIARGGYDYVILQDQSVQPALIGTRDGLRVLKDMMEMIEFVRRHNPQAKIILEITWGRRSGNDAMDKYGKTIEKYPYIFESYNSMQQALSRGIRAEAIMFDTGIADVGKTWSEIRRIEPDLQLYCKDGSHPSYAGSYLAATVIYTAIYGKPLGRKAFHGQLDSRTARLIRRTAWKNR